MITFGNKLNRRYSVYFPFMNTYGLFDVYFHRNNSYLAINVDYKFVDYLKDNRCWFYIFRDLPQSPFAKTFLDIRDVQSKRMDIQNQFFDIKEEHKGNIQYLNNETIKISKIEIGDKIFESFLYVYTFTIDNQENEFIYTVVERQHIDIPLQKKIVRTCGVQISTNEKLEEMVKRYNYENGKNKNNTSSKKINIRELNI